MSNEKPLYEEIGESVKVHYYSGSFRVKVEQNREENHEYKVKFCDYGPDSITELVTEMQTHHLKELGEMLLEAAENKTTEDD